VTKIQNFTVNMADGNNFENGYTFISQSRNSQISMEFGEQMHTLIQRLVT